VQTGRLVSKIRFSQRLKKLAAAGRDMVVQAITQLLREAVERDDYSPRAIALSSRNDNLTFTPRPAAPHRDQRN
jgi:hypothetical protein